MMSTLTELTDNQLVLLDNLIYLKDVANRNGTKVSFIVRDLLYRDGLKKSATEKDGEIHYPGQMSKEEWISILKAIEKDPQLMNLKVQHGRVGEVYDKNGKPVLDGNGDPLEVGDRMAAFVDSTVKDPKEAIVVFRGTSGDIEWHDNGMGGYLSDTEMQQRALKYVNGLPYDNIIATGHSKGGNKAQYVGLLSDKVDRVLSLDGQGFSKEFVEKYKDLIEANKHKITSIAAESDYVNCLLIPVADKFIYIDTEYQMDFLRNHSPGIVLDKNGQLRDDTSQSAISRLINDLTIYLNANIEEPGRSYAIDGLLALLESGEEGFERESDLQIEKAKEIVIPYVKEYALERLSEGGEDFKNLLKATWGTVIKPEEFADDFLHYLKINVENFKFAADLGIEVVMVLGSIGINMAKDYLIGLAEKIQDKAKKIAASIMDFAHKIKDGWDVLVRKINDFMDDLKGAGAAALEAVGRFKDKVVQGLQDFGSWVANGTKKAIDAVENAWNSSVDKVKGWIGDAKDKITNAVEGLKDGVKRVADLTREGFNKFIDASVTKAKEVGNWVVGKLEQARDKIKEIGSKISAAFVAFADKLKEGWENLKSGMARLAEKAKNTAVQAYQAIAQFGQNLIQTVKSFCDKLVAAYKQIVEGLKKAWNFTVDKVKGLFGWTKDKVTAGVIAVKDGVKRVADLTREGIHKFIDASVTKAKEIGSWMVSKLNQARDKVKEIGAKISATFTAFADKLKEGWESLKNSMKNMAEKAKATAVRVYEAVAQFAQNLIQTVKGFCSKLAAAYKSVMEGLKKTWDKVVDNVTSLYGKVKSAISLKITEFKDNIKSAVTLTKGKVKDLGKQAYQGVKKFTGKVVKGLTKITGGLLMVSVDRLSDLQSKFKRTDDDFLSTTNRITSDADRIVSSVSRAYSEPNVQSQIRQLQKAIDDARNRSRLVADEMQRKIRSISFAREQYVKIEQTLKSEIRSFG